MEVSIFGSYLSNAFDSETDMQTTAVRLGAGERVRLYVDLPWLRLRSASVVPGGGLGPIPIDPRRRGPGGGGQSGHGAGAGGSLPDTTDPAGQSSVLLTDEWTSGIGDVRVGAGHRLVGSGGDLYRADVELEVKVPTADETENLGTGELDVRLGASGEYRFWSVSVFGGAGLNLLGDPEWADLNDVVDAFAGFESGPLAERVLVSGWLQANEEVVAGAGSPVVIGVGARSVGKLRWSVRVTRRVSGPVEDLGAGFGVSYGLDREGVRRR